MVATACCLERDSSLQSKEGDLKEPASLLSCGDRVQNSEKPRRLGYTGQTTREVRALGDKASKIAVFPLSLRVWTLLIHELVSILGASHNANILTDCDS